MIPLYPVIEQACSVKIAGYSPIKMQQRTRPVSSHLDQTSVVNEEFIILLSEREGEIPSRQDGPTLTLLIAVDDSCHLPSQLCVLLPVVSFCLEGPDSCVEAKPMRIHRSNSDSNLYCKTMVSEDSGQTPIITERRLANQSRYLDQERLAFVQSYLKKAEDARSMTTETSDSGVSGIRGTPSEFGLEDTNGKSVNTFSLINNS